MDPPARRALWDRLVEGLAEEEVSILFTTHELEAVERIAERVVLLHGGRTRIDEPLESLRQRFRRVPAEAAAGLREVGTVATAWGERRVVSDWPGEAGEAGGGIADPARAEVMSLEEIFDALIREESP